MAIDQEILKVGVSGVRGVVGESFTPQRALGFAQALGVYVGPGPVLIGRDTRPSGPAVEMAVVAGLLSVGCRPVRVGVVPTPTLLYLTRHRGAAGAIAITASHNAAPWNALKFISRRGLFLTQVQAEELFDLYHQQDFPLVPESEIQQAETLDHPFDDHARAILDYVDTAAIRARGFPVAVDCCNGVGAVYARAFLEQLGCRVTAIHDAPTGHFQRPPEPLPENLGALGDAVREAGAAVGFAQDPDGDRLALLDERGQPLGEDFTVALGARQVLAAHGKGPVAVNESSSKCVDDAVAPFGVDVIRTPTGEINVSETMLRIGAVAGGENSGGLIVPAIHPCRDSFAAMAIILELLAHEGRPLSALRAELPAYHLIKEKIPIPPGRAPELLRAARHHFAGEKISLLDGVHVSRDGSWIQVRRSNTEPVVRIIAEATTRDEVEALVEETRAVLLKALR